MRGMRRQTIKEFFRLFCNHDYEKIDFYEAIDRGIRYSVRIYRCSKCGKVIHVDGRKDLFCVR